MFLFLTFLSHAHDSTLYGTMARAFRHFLCKFFCSSLKVPFFDRFQTRTYRRIFVQAPQKVRCSSRLRSAGLSHQYHRSLNADHELQQPCCPDSVHSGNQNLRELFLGIVKILGDDVDPGNPEELLGVKIILEYRWLGAGNLT